MAEEDERTTAVDQWREVEPSPIGLICDEMHELNSSGLHVNAFCRVCAEIYGALNLALEKPGYVALAAVDALETSPRCPDITIEDYARQLTTLQDAVGAYAKAQSGARMIPPRPDDDDALASMDISGWAWLRLPSDQAAAIERCGFGVSEPLRSAAYHDAKSFHKAEHVVPWEICPHHRCQGARRIEEWRAEVVESSPLTPKDDE